MLFIRISCFKWLNNTSTPEEKASDKWQLYLRNLVTRVSRINTAHRCRLRLTSYISGQNDHKSSGSIERNDGREHVSQMHSL